MKAIIISFLILLFIACQNNQSNKLTDTKTSIVDEEKSAKIIDETEIDYSQYALTFPYMNIGNMEETDSLYLFGKYPLGKTITLINNKNGEVFETKTLNYSVLLDEGAASIMNKVITRLIGENP